MAITILLAASITCQLYVMWDDSHYDYISYIKGAGVMCALAAFTLHTVG